MRMRIASSRDLGQLEHQRGGQVRLLGRSASGRTAAPGCSDRRSSPARTRSFSPCSAATGNCVKPRIGHSRGPPTSPACAEAVGLVVRPALGHLRLHLPVALEVLERAFRRVDRHLVEIGGAEPRLLRVEVGEQPALQQRVVARSRCPARCWPGRNATCSVSAKKLSGLRSSTMRPTIADRQHLLRDELGGVEDVVRQRCRRSPRRRSGRRAPIRGNRRAAIASNRSRRWKSGSAPAIFTASSQNVDCMPSFGRQWNFTKVDSPLSR